MQLQVRSEQKAKQGIEQELEKVKSENIRLKKLIAKILFELYKE